MKTNITKEDAIALREELLAYAKTAGPHSTCCYTKVCVFNYGEIAIIRPDICAALCRIVYNFFFKIYPKIFWRFEKCAYICQRKRK